MFTSFNARAVGLSLSAHETIEIAAATGFEGVDLLVRDLTEAREPVAALKKRMNDLGLKPGAFPLPVNWRGGDTVFQRDLQALAPLADAAAEFGLLRTGTWVTPEIPESLNSVQQCVDWHVERLGAIAELLAQRSIRLGLEVIGPAKSRTGRTPRFITTLTELAPILDPLASLYPNVGVLFDTFHLYAADEPLESALAASANRIVWVHVADLPAGASGVHSEIDDPVRGLPGNNLSLIHI